MDVGVETPYFLKTSQAVLDEIELEHLSEESFDDAMVEIGVIKP